MNLVLPIYIWSIYRLLKEELFVHPDTTLSMPRSGRKALWCRWPLPALLLLARAPAFVGENVLPVP